MWLSVETELVMLVLIRFINEYLTDLAGTLKTTRSENWRRERL